MTAGSKDAHRLALLQIVDDQLYAAGFRDARIDEELQRRGFVRRVDAFLQQPQKFALLAAEIEQI